jgi:FkbH-like protein
MKSFAQLRRNLKKINNSKPIKIAILGDSATQFLTQAIKGTGIDNDINFDVFEADFNQIERQVYDLSSELYKFEPEIVIVFQSSHKLLLKYNKINPEEHSLLASNEMSKIENIYSNLSSNLEAKVIYYNYTEIDDAVFGNYANKVESSFLFQVRKLNYELMCFASKSANLYLCDISTIQNQIGKLNFFQPSVYVNSDMVLSIDALPKIASKTIDIISTLNGKFKKCVILDLDNTTWGGVIGDDGIENIQIGSLGIGKSFSEFQYWIKKLKERGVILAVCSKNTEAIAMEPFEKHPEMVLRLKDISVFRANWENKADNIRQIQSILNIGFDSIVFLDDNPFERNIVRENIPEICVPELPEDPANYLEFLYELNLFETASFSNEDSERTKLYQIEAERVKVYKKFTNEDDFLKNLNMLSDIQFFNKFNIPRVAQLSQRSNQFNLRTIRYSEADIEKISVSNDYLSFAYTLEDNFGDNGLICVVILKKECQNTLFIDTWFMSCRVLKRGMENFVLSTIINTAKENGFNTIIGEYISTNKNDLVKDHYTDLGFRKEQNRFYLDIKDYQEKLNYIKIKL